MDQSRSTETKQLRRLAAELWPQVDELCERLEMFHLPLKGLPAEGMADALDDADLWRAETIMAAMFARLGTTTASEVTVRPGDLQEAGVCFPGYRRWTFERDYRLMKLALVDSPYYSDEDAARILAVMRARFEVGDDFPGV